MIRDGKPTAVILPIGNCQALLEQLEQHDDIRAIREMPDADWQTTSFDNYLKEADDGLSDRTYTPSGERFAQS